MTTLHEETSNSINYTSSPNQDKKERNKINYCDYEIDQAEPALLKSLTSSRTLDSFIELQSVKLNTPSVTSSGYGSQTASTTNLTEDCISIKSVNIDDTPDFENKSTIEGKRQEKRNNILLNETTEEYLMDFKPKQENTALFQNQIISSNTDVVHIYTKSTKKDCISLLQNQKPNDFENSDLKVERERLFIESNDLKKTDENAGLISDTDDSSFFNKTSTVETNLSFEKIVRRKKDSLNNLHGFSQSLQRASFPMVRANMIEVTNEALPNSTVQPSISSKDYINKNICNIDLKSDIMKTDTTLPEWVSIGESVLVRPYSYTGIIAYVGPTHFATGTWIGVELDAPTGKNDGTVNGHKYFICRAKYGIFVKIDKLIQDKRGRSLRTYVKQDTSPTSISTIHRSTSKAENLNLIHRSRSRGEGFAISGLRATQKHKK